MDTEILLKYCKMAFMHGHYVHAQHVLYESRCDSVTWVQNILWNFVMILLYLGYNKTSLILRLWQYGLLGPTRGAVPGPMSVMSPKVHKDDIPLLTFTNKIHSLDTVLVADMWWGMLVVAKVVTLQVKF